MPLLSIRDLKVSFHTDGKEQVALHGVDLDIFPGETLALVGESGSGKSVTAMSILRLLPQPPARYDSGRIILHDGEQELDLLSSEKDELRHIRGRRISMIFQEPMTSLDPVMTCGDQVAEAIRNGSGIGRKQAREKVIDLFRKVNLPDPEAMYDRYPHQLSGGQKQRVMIAMAIQAGPALLIADEPTTALDVTVQQTILELLREIQRSTGMAILFITHDLGLVRALADRVAVMYKGDIVETGTVEKVMQQPANPYTKALLACRPSAHAKGQRLPSVANIMAGASMPPMHEPAISVIPARDDGNIISVEDLRVWFSTRTNFWGKALARTKAVDGVSFAIRRGETLGLVGESGCGKTTLGRALLGLIPASSGKIEILGKDVANWSERAWRNLRKDVQVVFQDPYSSLNPRMTIGEAIREPMAVHGLQGNGRQRRDKVVELLEKVDLKADHYDRYPHEFSGGQRQRIGIARALALDPSFIVFDESVSALDVSVQAQVLNLINDLKNEYGFTSLFISHDLGVIRYISDRVLVMEKGRIVEQGTAEQVFRQPAQEYTRRLIAAIPDIDPGSRIQDPGSDGAG